MLFNLCCFVDYVGIYFTVFLPQHKKRSHLILLSATVTITYQDFRMKIAELFWKIEKKHPGVNVTLHLNLRLF